MHNSSSRKAQFFILTTVVIVGVFYTLSKYINPYAFVGTSDPIIGGEESFFDNVKDKAIKTVTISARDDTTLKYNLEKYKNFIINMSSEKGYDLSFSYTVQSSDVNVSMVLLSQKTTLASKFTIPRP